MVDFTKKIK
jgi:hypothetical protein